MLRIARDDADKNNPFVPLNGSILAGSFDTGSAIPKACQRDNIHNHAIGTR